MKCALCNGKLAYRKMDRTHAYVCVECPAVLIEYYGESDIDNLKNIERGEGMRIPIEFDDKLQVFYGDDIVNARLAVKDMIFHGELEVVLEGEKRDYIKVTDIVSINDKELDYKDMAIINGIHPTTYKQRLDRGWSKIDACTVKAETAGFRLKSEKRRVAT